MMHSLADLFPAREIKKKSRKRLVEGAQVKLKAYIKSKKRRAKTN